MKRLVFLFLAILLFGIVGSANALTINASLWSGVTSDRTGAEARLIGDLFTNLGNIAASDTFDVGTIDFTTPAADYLAFFGGAGNVSNWVGANIGSALTTNSSTAFFVELKGTMYFNGNDALTHDDGAWLSLSQGGGAATEFDFSTATSPFTHYLVGLPAGVYDFTLNYSGWNGIPEVLKLQPVPEPATLLLFGLGILGLAGVSRKKYQK